MKKLFTLKSSSTTNRILITLLLCVTVGTQSMWGQEEHDIFTTHSVNASAGATTATISYKNRHMNGNDWIGNNNNSRFFIHRH